MTVLVIRQDKLDKTPLAFQQYVEEFFESQLVIGIPCWRLKR